MNEQWLPLATTCVEADERLLELPRGLLRMSAFHPFQTFTSAADLLPGVFHGFGFRLGAVGPSRTTLVSFANCSKNRSISLTASFR